MAKNRDTEIRCAIYTRKSTDEGLEQEFNSLDAQREAGEAYVASQKHEGWVCLPQRYDDGGFTGGNMERPALRRLLADVEAGRIDCIVVYKVDRLSRSLLDFARIVETLEKHAVTFVSVTQQFNTTSSMGRLTLNILLSFAQFEREIISERTRDKIAAAKRRGKWSGGRPVLGYDVHPNGGKLIVNEDEAGRVRAIFDLYLDYEALLSVVKDIASRGWHNKRWVTKKGKEVGGRPFNNNSLYKLLTNILYTGKLTYKDELHEGEHEAIIDAETFQHVQRMLKRNGASGGKHVRNQFGALLKGIIRCDACGCAMVPTHTTKNKTKRYRYYVCSNAQKQGWHTCPSKSIPAPEIERFVVDEIKAIGRDPALAEQTLEQLRQQHEARVSELEAEKAALMREIGRAEQELRKVVECLGQDATAAARMADLQDRIRSAEARYSEVCAELKAIESEQLDSVQAAQALAAFDPVWENLTLREQAKVIHLLVEKVSYHGGDGTVAISFHSAGIQALTQRFEGASV
jgi:site-specific DNA recombinase